MKIVQTNAGAFDQARKDRFQKAYDACTKVGKTQFELEGHTWLTSYVKYLLEYLTNEGLK